MNKSAWTSMHGLMIYSWALVWLRSTMNDFSGLYTHLRDKKLFISKKKFDPFAPVLDILGCKVDAHGVHVDLDKLTKLRNWHVPADHMEVLCFLGLIEY